MTTVRGLPIGPPSSWAVGIVLLIEFKNELSKAKLRRAFMAFVVKYGGIDKILSVP